MTGQTDPGAKRLPLKNEPLRTPGQGLTEQVTGLVYGRAMMWMMLGLVMVAMAGQEWVRWYLKTPPMPIVVTVVAVVVCGFAAWRVRKLLPSVRRLLLGLMGEKYVGQWLESKLRPKGYQVFHDIQGDGFNIDHVLVGPAGVFAIETKTVSKPARGKTEIVSDGESVTINGMTPDRNPIVQARAAGKHLERLVREMTGEDVAVRPVVFYPGWFTKHHRGSDVWVLEESGLLAFLQNERSRKTPLSVEKVNFLAAGIDRHIREREKAS